MAKLFESGENYLETILFIKKRQDNVRSIDIANELNYSKASVSRAMGIMKKEGFLIVDEDGFIHFTEKGNEKANSIYLRHNIITDFLSKTLHLDKKDVENDACKMEHYISIITFDAMKKFLEDNNT